jgi:flagellar basal-body rod modification protein FlgD
MTVTATTGASSTSPYTTEKSGFASLGQQDFFRLMTTQMQMQDPFDPVDNKEMLAQMAQFSSLAGISTMGDTLTSIADKLDALLAQQAAGATQNDTETTQSQSDQSSGDTPTTQN